MTTSIECTCGDTHYIQGEDTRGAKQTAWNCPRCLERLSEDAYVGRRLAIMVDGHQTCNIVPDGDSKWKKV